MRTFIAIIVAIAGGLPPIAQAQVQETNYCFPLPATKLEAFETNTDTVIIKATAPMGSVPAQGGEVAVRCREITDAGSGRRETGIIIDLELRRAG